MKSAEFMQIAEKIMPQNVNKKGEFVNIPEVILPKSERQIRPLINKLKHNGERIKVWCEVEEARFNISGHSRWSACKELGINEVSVIVSDMTNQLDIEEAVIIANNQRKLYLKLCTKTVNLCTKQRKLSPKMRPKKVNWVAFQK